MLPIAISNATPNSRTVTKMPEIILCLGGIEFKDAKEEKPECRVSLTPDRRYLSYKYNSVDTESNVDLCGTLRSRTQLYCRPLALLFEFEIVS
jgi:hypothetical protein